MALRILGPEAFRPALTGLAERFREISGQSVEPCFGPTTGAAAESITNRLLAGVECDIVFLPAAMTDQQIAAGRLNPKARIDAMRSVVGLCVREGAVRPDISDVDALRATLLAARSIGLSPAGSGIFVRESLLPRLDLAGSVGPRCKTIADRPVGAAVAAGEVDIGLQQLSDLLQETGIDVVGPLPEAVQGHTVIAASAPSGPPLNESQTAFLAFLRSDEAAEIVRPSGLQPVPA